MSFVICQEPIGIHDENIKNYPGNCDRKTAEKFLKDNASFIDY